MRLTVIGATGGIGTEVVRQALDAGHEVTAAVRDPARMAVAAPDRLRVVQADVLDAEAVLPAVKGADAVVSALGPRRGGPATVVSDGARAALTAMDAAAVRRLVIVSANGAYDDPGDGLAARLVVKPILQRVLREGFADLHQMEDLVRARHTDWTIVRPPRLTNRPRTGRYRTAVDAHVGTSIARADVADAILAALADPATIGHHLGVGR
jgi:putative NADH-flavin reductase